MAIEHSKISESDCDAAALVAKRNAYRYGDFEFEVAAAWLTIDYRPNNLQRAYRWGTDINWLSQFECDLATGAYGPFPHRKSVVNEVAEFVIAA